MILYKVVLRNETLCRQQQRLHAHCAAVDCQVDLAANSFSFSLSLVKNLARFSQTYISNHCRPTTAQLAYQISH